MPDPFLTVLLVCAALQAVLWTLVAAGLRRVRDDAFDTGLLDDPDGEDRDRASADVPPIQFSVVVAARNEAARLPALLAALDRQTHRGPDGEPRFEVVVVDDRSTDTTEAVVRRQQDRWQAHGGPALRLVTVAEGDPEAAGLPPKKHALTVGIQGAVHARLALTDADCQPPPEWLATLARHAAADAPLGGEAADHRALLVGYSPMRKAPGMLNRFARFETLQTALLAAAGVGWGRPWQGVGRNLSYPAVLLDRVGGFAGASLSGDDDLLVQAAARVGWPVRYVLDPASFVPTDAPATWRAFWRQKRRHASAGAHYASGVLVGLGALRLSSLALWLGAPLYHLATGQPTAWGVLALVLLVQRIAWRDAVETFRGHGDLSLAQPLLEAASAVYHAVFGLLGTLPAPRRW